MHYRLFIAATAAIALAGCGTEEKVELENTDQRYGYAVGWQIGQNILQSGIELDARSAAAALEDALANREPRLDDADMQEAMEMAQRQELERQAGAADGNRRSGEEFMAEYVQQDGVHTSEEGLAWRILEEGDGPMPAADASVLVHYEGSSIDGRVFDSSYERGEPVSFPLDAVIEGWQIVLQRMPEGSLWEVVIPADLAYGDQGAGGTISAGETLVFEIELLDADL